MSASTVTLWHYTDGTTSFGPLSTTVIRQLIATGVIASGFHLRRDEEDAWTPLDQINLDAQPAAPFVNVRLAPPTVDEPVYHLTRNGKNWGPFRPSELRAMLASNQASVSDMLWKEGMAEWRPLGSISELLAKSQSKRMPQVHSVQPSMSHSPRAGTKSANDTLGPLLVLIPIIGGVLMWFWVSGMGLRSNPSNTLVLFIVGTILLTSALAAVDADKRDVTLKLGGTVLSGPIAWFALIAPFWIIALPVYLLVRNRPKSSGQFIGGILAVALFGGAALATHRKIDNRISFREYQNAEEIARNRATVYTWNSMGSGGTQSSQTPRNCIKCGGTGKITMRELPCSKCNGAGTTTTPSGYVMACTTCGGNGEYKTTCSQCGGSGQTR